MLRRFQTLIIPGSRFSHRVVSAGIWSITFRAADRLINLARVVVLARILTPNDFGLLGIAMLSLAFVQAFSITGFGEALIQKKEDITSYLDTAWTVSIIRGAIIAVVLYLSAGYVAGFFDTMEAKSVIQVIGSVMLLKGFANQGIIYFQKDLEFHKLFIYDFGRTLAVFVTSVILALLWKNVWALVWGVIAGDIVATILSYVLHPYRPRLRFDFQKAKQLYTFGRWIYLSTLLTFLSAQLDKGVIGKVIGSASLGLYQVGSTISNTATGELSQAISQVVFPAYSKLQLDLSRLRQTFLTTWENTACLTLPLSILVLILAGGIVQVVLGPQWLPAVTAVRILAMAGFFTSLIRICGALLQAIGKPRLHMQLNLVQIAVAGILIYPLTRLMEINGAALAMLGGALLAIPFALRYIKTHVNIPVKDFLKASMASVILSLAVGVISITVGFSHSENLMGLVLILALNLVVYIGISFALWWWFKSGPVRIIVALRNDKPLQVK